MSLAEARNGILLAIFVFACACLSAAQAAQPSLDPTDARIPLLFFSPLTSLDANARFWIGADMTHTTETESFNLSDGYRYSTAQLNEGNLEVGQRFKPSIAWAGQVSSTGNIVLGLRYDFVTTEDFAIGADATFTVPIFPLMGSTGIQASWTALPGTLAAFCFSRLETSPRKLAAQGYDLDHPTPYNQVEARETSLLAAAGVEVASRKNVGATFVFGWREELATSLGSELRGPSAYDAGSGWLLAIKVTYRLKKPGSAAVE